MRFFVCFARQWVWLGGQLEFFSMVLFLVLAKTRMSRGGKNVPGIYSTICPRFVVFAEGAIVAGGVV